MFYGDMNAVPPTTSEVLRSTMIERLWLWSVTANILHAWRLLLCFAAFCPKLIQMFWNGTKFFSHQWKRRKENPALEWSDYGARKEICCHFTQAKHTDPEDNILTPFFVFHVKCQSPFVFLVAFVRSWNVRAGEPEDRKASLPQLLTAMSHHYS